MKKSTMTRLTLLLAATMASPAAYPQEDGGAPLDFLLDDTPLAREETAAVTSYSAMLREVRPAVVSVFSKRVVEGRGLDQIPGLGRFFGDRGMAPPPDEQVQRGIGSGVVVSPQGYILTNNHVIAEADEVAVLLDDGRELDAEVIGADPQTDIALLRVRADGLAAATLGDSDQTEVGDVVFALGNPLGIGHSVTTGIISARGRSEIGILGAEGFEDFIQTDAAMNVGNSGGPLVDAQGRVLGINTAIASPGGGNIGIGFAVPINLARGVVESLVEFGEVRRGFVGIQMQRLTPELAEEFQVPEPRGALIVDVISGSPGEEAGLQTGDVIVELDGQPVQSASDVRLMVGQMAPGTSVEMSLIREGEPTSVSVELRARDESAEVAGVHPGADYLLEGLALQELTPEHRAEQNLPEDVEGLVITEIDPGSPYAGVLPEGGIIMQINRHPATDLASAEEALREGRNLFLVQHRGVLAYVIVDVMG